MFANDQERDAKIMQHQNAVIALEKAKAEEMALRKELLAHAFHFGTPEHAYADLRSGTENLELGLGYKLKAVFRLNYKLGDKEQVEKTLQKIEKTGEEGRFIADRLVKWKPELSVSEYNQLPEKFKKIIDEVVTVSPGTPSLELVPPKGK